MKTGLFFGTFNPIHDAHVAIGNYFTQSLDQVWFVLTPLSVEKSHLQKSILPSHHRLAMLNIALNHHSKLIPCNYEKNLTSPYYSYHTIKKIKQLHPEHQFYLIMGEDNQLSFSTWYKADEIKKEVDILTYPRNHNELAKNTPLYPTSSTQIRAELKKGTPVNGLDSEVLAYIKKNKLY